MMTEFLAENLPIIMLVAFAVLIFTGFPVASMLAGVGIAAALVAIFIDVFPEAAFYNIPLRISGNFPHSWVYPAVVMLLFMGVALEKSGIAREMLNCLHLLFLRVPGSLAVCVTIIGILLVPSAGLVGASVGTLTLVALPTMLAQRYPVPVATSAVAAGGTLGLILPPVLMLIFLADQMGVTVGAMFLSTVIPGFMLVGGYILYFLVRGLLDPALQRAATHVPEEESERLPSGLLVLYILRSLVLTALLIATVLGSIIAGWVTTSQSAALGAAGSLVLRLLNGSFSIRRLHEVIRSILEITAVVFLIVMAAQIFSYPFRFLSGGELVRELITGLGLNDWGILLTVLLIILVLGFFIDWIEITVITLPIFYPLLITPDFAAYAGSPHLAAISIGAQIAMVLQTSFLTPSFGFALFHIRAAAPPSVQLLDIYRGVAPILGLQLAMIVLVLMFPALAAHLSDTVFDVSADR